MDAALLLPQEIKIPHTPAVDTAKQLSNSTEQRDRAMPRSITAKHRGCTVKHVYNHMRRAFKACQLTAAPGSLLLKTITQSGFSLEYRRFNICYYRCRPRTWRRHGVQTRQTWSKAGTGRYRYRKPRRYQRKLRHCGRTTGKNLWRERDQRSRGRAIV